MGNHSTILLRGLLLTFMEQSHARCLFAFFCLRCLSLCWATSCFAPRARKRNDPKVGWYSVPSPPCCWAHIQNAVIGVRPWLSSRHTLADWFLDVLFAYLCYNGTWWFYVFMLLILFSVRVSWLTAGQVSLALRAKSAKAKSTVNQCFGRSPKGPKIQEITAIFSTSAGERTNWSNQQRSVSVSDEFETRWLHER